MDLCGRESHGAICDNSIHNALGASNVRDWLGQEPWNHFAGTGWANLQSAVSPVRASGGVLYRLEYDRHCRFLQSQFVAEGPRNDISSKIVMVAHASLELLLKF